MSNEDADPELDLHAAAEAEGADALVLALDSFDGPLNLLLDLARAKKLDLTHVPITDIADQFLAFIAEARAHNIEVAGDYLVMAAWLALLKSRLLLPKPQAPSEELDPDQMAAALRAKLMRLELARAAAKRLDAMAQLNRDVFLAGQPQSVKLTKTTAWRADLHELLASYCAERSKSVRKRAYRTTVRRAFPLATARKSLEHALRLLKDWSPLGAVTPGGEQGPEAPPPSSYLASTFGAALELAREGRMDLRQAEAFAPLFVRARPAQNDAP